MEKGGWGDPEMVWGEKPKVEEITLTDFEKLINAGWEIKQDIAALESEIKRKNEVLSQHNLKILAHLQQNEKTSYDAAHCKVVATKRFTVSLPNTPEEKAQFFGYLKTKGIFEDLITVHSATLNSYFKQEMEIAKEEGNIDFKIPGISEPKLFESITYRKR